MLYEPVICLILQGRKVSVVGQATLDVGPGESLLVSHDVPVTARVTEASPQHPYVAVVLTVDTDLVRSLYDEVADALGQSPQAATSTAIDTPDPRFVDCLSRYLALANDPLEAQVMGPHVMREIHLRMLMSKQGGMLRALLRHDSHASNIAKAIARIRRDFRTTIVVPKLARDIGMYASSFHKHFKSITQVTPLQYQKELRLLEAKRLLVAGDRGISDIAYSVGYESPNQFSREFARKFGSTASSHRAATSK